MLLIIIIITIIIVIIIMIIIIIYIMYIYIYMYIIYIIYMAQQNPSFEATAKCLPNAMGCNVRLLKHLLAEYLD